MWNLVDSNKRVGTFLKVESYKNHLKNLKSVKPQINVDNPWKPSFSLSKRKNKYYKFLKNEVEKQNEVLLNRMIKLQGQPMTQTCMNIPLSIPSNKTTYSQIKQRERHFTNHEINKENLKILQKIEGAESDYGKRVWRETWKQNMKYKHNILKKQYVPDFVALVKQQQNFIRKIKNRPQTANVYS